ncbi:MAG: chemotaxis-specific protein-glutamate methyltransferase CheB [Treponema sp.]|nr:chemotaxis-specific protein-glutamate methyltransferase CheB [Treponema sp.]
MINTLIVDDSPLARDILRDFLEGGGFFRIIGEAVDGEDGVEKILSLNPDLVTLDIEMPKMNGLQVIEEVMKKTAVPIVVITSLDTAKTAYEATVRGALEFYPKDTFASSMDPDRRREIYETLKRISGVKTRKRGEDAEAAVRPPEKRKIDAVVVASSTGGPRALSTFFSLLPADFPVPVVVVQHNSSGFDKGFAQWLDTYTPLEVKLAEEGERPRPGRVYIAQTDRHLLLEKRKGELFLVHDDGSPENNQKPAADVLFKSAAESLGEALVSVVLTGMGSDGAAGTRLVRESGGVTLAQDEDSSLIYGMPRAAAETGCVDMVLSLEKIPPRLDALVRDFR